jgi:uncharacterized repeat protein (TIGR02543 family)
VEYIEDEAFAYCNNFSSVHNLCIFPQEINATTFEGVPINNIDLYVPVLSIPDYKNADIWKDFKQIIPLEGVCTVTFNPNNGDTDFSKQIEYNQPVAQPETPFNPGHSFTGWYKDGEEWDFNAPVTENITLTAQWSTVGIDNLFLSDVEIYPNPYTTYVKIRNAEGADLKIINIKEETVRIIKNLSDLQEISMENFAAGVYMFQITKDGKVRTVKTVKN